MEINREYIKGVLKEQIIDSQTNLDEVLSCLDDDMLWKNLSDENKKMIDKMMDDDKTVPITYYQIREQVGWSQYCDVTGGNHYALNEGYSPADHEVFHVKKKHARELGLIK